MQGLKASKTESSTIVYTPSYIKALHFIIYILLVDDVLILGKTNYERKISVSSSAPVCLLYRNGVQMQHHSKKEKCIKISGNSPKTLVLQRMKSVNFRVDREEL